jgi:AraC family transcriptional regulator of adaptative response / DNA-3-methyladenine glycosylase II
MAFTGSGDGVRNLPAPGDAGRYHGTMELDPARCYRAALARDRRFDGRFFAGVVTTGVYCRPVCPVAPARPENVRWFPCAAAAEAAGFRPCRRCRPETSPGTPAWIGSSAVVSRALRLISDGALDAGPLEGLASRLGLGVRQLRRLFARHLGASPARIARARRVHFARRLLDETELSITQLAFSAGFRSIREFNHLVRATFGRSPTELRRGRHRRGPLADGGGLVVRLPYRPPLDWAAMLRFVEARAIPGVEMVEDGRYRRTIEIDGAAGSIDVRKATDDGHLLMRVELPGPAGLIGIVERVRRIFDLDADPVQITEQLRLSPPLRAAIDARPGLRVPGAWDGFELAVRAVLGQQVTVRAATTLAGRLVRAFGREVEGCGAGLSHVFPRPGTLAEADLSSIGLPRARAATVRALAAGVATGALALDASQGLEETVARLCTVPGIGPWTAHYIAMRAFGEPDAFPSGDLGLRRALARGSDLPSISRLNRLAETWRPWRAYAAMYLWVGINGARSTKRRSRA